MATLADSFLQDLEDLEDDDLMDQRQVPLDEDENEDEIPDAIELWEKTDESAHTTVSNFLKDKEFTQLMEDVRRRKDETTMEAGQQLTEEHEEYQLIMRCNTLVREIDEEMFGLHRYVRDIYAKRFPELESIVPSPLDYLQVVQRAGNVTDMAALDFTDILPNQTIMAITVTFSMTSGSPLPQKELEQAMGGADEAFQLNDCKRDVLLYLESRMSGLAPNLSALLGASLAAKLVTAAGGLLNLARMPAQNIMIIGSMKKNLVGMSGASHSFGLIMQSDIILGTPAAFRNRAIKLVAGKCGLAARVDSFHESPLGQVGTQLRERILQALVKAQEPPPAKEKKPLPKPDEQKKPRRGGKRHRAQKEKFGMSDFQKEMNRTKFTPTDFEEDISQEHMGVGFGMVSKFSGMGRVRGAREKMIEKQLPAIKRQKMAAAAGARESGMSSSLAFTPVQGIELANPEAQKQRREAVGAEKYFSQGAGFVNIRRK